MLVQGLLVESVYLRRVGGSAGGNDVLGDRFDGCQVAPGEKKLGPLTRKGACDRAADRASGSVDHRNLVLQHHLWFLSLPGCRTDWRAWRPRKTCACSSVPQVIRSASTSANNQVAGES